MINKGLASVAVSCITSGLAAVSVESAVKEKKSNLWEKNVQMSAISLIIAMFNCTRDWSAISKHGFFAGYHPLVFLVIFIQALGGLIVSIVVKYTDSIVKGFAASGSVILSSIASQMFLQDVKMNSEFVAGSAVTCLAAFAYSQSSKPKSKQIATVIARNEFEEEEK